MSIASTICLILNDDHIITVSAVLFGRMPGTRVGHHFHLDGRIEREPQPICNDFM